MDLAIVTGIAECQINGSFPDDVSVEFSHI